MFSKHNSLIIGLSLACVTLSSCVDDKYDLSDIDTTVRVDVNRLTVPIKLDEIKLSSILEENDRLKIIDGQYMVVEKGNFTSNPIYVAPTWIKAKSIPTSVITVPYVPGIVTDDVTVDFTTPEAEFNFNATGLPVEITGIDAVGGDLKFRLAITVAGLNNVARKVALRDLVLQIPKGLTVTEAGECTYDAATGILTVPSLDLDNEGFMDVHVSASKADFAAMGSVFDYDAHSVEVKGAVNIKSGKIAISDFINSSKAAEIRIYVTYEFADFLLETFSGGLDYKLAGVNFTDIRLDGLPDLLIQPGTNIKISNPCIFLKVSNPVQAYGLTAQTGFAIIASHDELETTYAIDNPFTIGNNHTDGIYTYCLSPKQPTSVPEGYANPEHVLYSSLSDVLSNAGHEQYGIPAYLYVKLVNPCIPNQKIVDMPIGRFLDEAHGSYEFRAPIALEEGSVISYEETVTGWGSDEFDYITVTQLDIDAKLSCDIPMAFRVEAYPVDKKGNVINNVRIEGVDINAGSEPQDVHIHITGDVTGFDGIRYVAKAIAGAGNQVLSTDMNIRVTNLRPTISGYYMKEL